MSNDGSHRERVIFLCTHNSARSQMAEGMLRAWGAARFEAFSAGTVKTALRPEAVEVMREIGIDISRQESKAIDQLAGRSFERLVTVCDEARESCPTLPGVRSSSTGRSMTHRRWRALPGSEWPPSAAPETSSPCGSAPSRQGLERALRRRRGDGPNRRPVVSSAAAGPAAVAFAVAFGSHRAHLLSGSIYRLVSI